MATRWLATDFGGPEVLQQVTVDLPPQGQATSLSGVPGCTDSPRLQALLGRAGPGFLPLTIGYEVSGVVTALGPGTQLGVGRWIRRGRGGRLPDNGKVWSEVTVMLAMFSPSPPPSVSRRRPTCSSSAPRRRRCCTSAGWSELTLCSSTAPPGPWYERPAAGSLAGCGRDRHCPRG